MTWRENNIKTDKKTQFITIPQFGGTILPEPNYLVNYVSCENGFKILEKGKILFKTFSETNDPREYLIHEASNTYYEPRPCSINACQNNYSHFHLLEPFIKNHLFAFYLSHKGSQSDFEEAAKNVLLWAHYGDSQKGMCIVYNTKKLKKICGNRFSRSTLGHVAYDLPKLEFNISSEIQQAGNKIEALANDILSGEYNSNIYQFHKKDKAWQYENEIRILAYHRDKMENNKIFVDIEGCIEAVILGDKFNLEACCICKLKPILKAKGIKLKQAKYKMKIGINATDNLFQIDDIPLD